MISRVIEWCAHNRFLVFTGVLLLTLTGIWSMGHIPLDALPDISDVEVIIHTNWEGEPPNIIEDQVSYPIVTALLAAPTLRPCAPRRCLTIAMCSLCSKTARISIGPVLACWSICKRLRVVSLPMYIPQLGLTQLARVGCTSMLSWTTATSTVSPICGRSRTGTYATNWRQFLASLKSPVWAALFASTKSASTQTSCSHTEFPFQP
jgi:hypothetical protein